MPDRAVVELVRRTIAGLGTRLRDVVTGASGLGAYEQYLRHLRSHHPGVQAMSREAFFSSDLAARWEGVRRCC